MQSHKKDYIIEISVALDGTDALVAYSDTELDSATNLNINHQTGALKASLQNGEKNSEVGCGTITEKMANRLKQLKSIIWCRQASEEQIGVTEITLTHTAV